MANSTKRDVNGRSVSKKCGRCEVELAPENFNLPARCWDCEDAHKADKEAEEASKTPEQRLQEAIDKYQKEYGHVLTSQWELISRLQAVLENKDPGWAEVVAEQGHLQPERGPDAILLNDVVIRSLQERLVALPAPASAPAEGL